MSRITVSEALQLVGNRIAKDPVTNRDEILFLIDRAQEAAYNKGTWWGMFKEVNIVTAGSEIYLPYPYTNLVAINVNGRPRIKRGVQYEFHQNGFGSKEDCYGSRRGCRWSESVVDRGEHAVPYQPKGHNLIVRCRAQEKPDSIVTIGGIGPDGRVLTYIYDEEEAKQANIIGKPLGECQMCSVVDESDKIKYTKTVFGEIVPLEGPTVMIQTQAVYDVVESITKTPTLGPVDIYVDFGQGAELLVTMEPEQTEAVFRRWSIPEDCSDCTCVHALVKMGEPAPVSHDNQTLLIKSRNALLYLCMSMHHEFNKFDPQLAEVYLSKGLLALDEQNDQNTTHTISPIQVRTPQSLVKDRYGFR